MTHGISALTIQRASTSTTADTAIRLVIAFASSVMTSQRGTKDIVASLFNAPDLLPIPLAMQLQAPIRPPVPFS